MFNKNTKAFTAVETLLAIGIIAATAGLTVPMYRNYQIRSDLDTVTQQTIQGLRRAQVLAQSGEQDLSWGYYVQDGVLFGGEAYVVRNTEFDEVYPVPTTINTSGLSEVVFSRIEGVPDRTGDIIIQALNGDQRIITIGTYGVLDTAEQKAAGDFGGTGDTGGDTSTGGSDGSTGDAGSDGSTGSTGGDTGTDGSTGDTGSTGSTGETTGDTDGGTTGGTDGGSSGGESGGDDEVTTCEDRFVINSDGAIETTGTVNATFEVLGSAITYGAGGPSIDVRVEASINNGETWFDLFDGAPVDGGETQTVQNLVSGTKVLLRVSGRYSWIFRKSYDSNDGTGHIEVLKNGDAVPDYPSFGNQDNVESFLRPIISNGYITLNPYDAVYLVELGNLGTASADFQDAVIKISFELVGACSTNDVPRFKVTFPRVENEGAGDAQNRVFVGEQAVPYAEGQWVPLQDAEGSVLLDNFLTEDVPGLAAWRNNSYVRFLLHGSHVSGSKEIVDALIEFDNATVTSIVNDINQNKTENWQDEVVNDGPGGDEVTLQSDNQTVFYQTRVTGADDAILVYWQSGNPAGSTGGDSGGTDGGTTGGTDGGTGGTDSGEGGTDSGGGDIADETPDPCAIDYTIRNGVVTINEPADITFRALGSHAFYGTRGPEISTYLHASFNGNNYETLFGNRDIDGGERQTFTDVPAGAQMVLKADGRYSWQFRNSAVSTETNRAFILKRHDPVPGTTPYQNVRNLQSFMRNIISDDGRIDIGKTSLVFLFELQNVNSDADYQDVAVEVFLEKPASEGICGGIGTDDTTGGDTGTTTGGTDGGTIGGTDGGTDGGDGGTGGTDEDKATICHFPPGNKQNPHTLTVGVSAVKAHMKHGDRTGACEDDDDGDTVLNGDDLCVNTYMPEPVPTTGSMLFRRYALTKDSPVFTTGPRKKFVSDYSLVDTKGCSCEQLIDVAEQKKTYYFDQIPRLHRNIKSLFPFYTRGARSYGCGEAILRMVKNYEL